jgi:DNA-directed RNA polymerase specialized sigma24 family protein
VWLYRIARSRCLAHLRRPPAPAELEENLEAGISAAEAAERRAELRGCSPT